MKKVYQVDDITWVEKVREHAVKNEEAAKELRISKRQLLRYKQFFWEYFLEHFDCKPGSRFLSRTDMEAIGVYRESRGWSTQINYSIHVVAEFYNVDSRELFSSREKKSFF